MSSKVTVEKLIEYLKTQPQDSEVWIKDSLNWEARPLEYAGYLGSILEVEPKYDDDPDMIMKPVIGLKKEKKPGTKKVFLI